jgi:hypothetical protein
MKAKELFTAYYSAGGQQYRLPVGAFFALASGKIRRVTNCYNLSEWVAQVSR